MGIKTHEALKYNTTEHYAWYVQCPACKTAHVFDARWKFDGNHEAPTFSPSMLVSWEMATDAAGKKVKHVCHSFLEAGVWRYLGDCTHTMKNQRVAAPDWLPSGMPPETDVAKKAEADAKKAADELEAKKAADARAAAAKAAAEKAAAKAKDETAKNDDEDKAPAEEAKGPPSRAEIKQKAARLYAAFRSDEVGLSDLGASILAAHLLTTVDKPEQMGATQAIAWAKTFRQSFPMVWGALRVGHMMNFTAAVRRSELESEDAETLATLASAIRS